MEHHVFCDRPVHLLLILLESGALYAAHGRGRPAESGVLGYRIVVVEFAPADTVRSFTLEIIIEITLVRDLFHPPCFQRIIIKSPADVIVAPQIIEECVFPRKGADDVHLFPQQADVSCGDRMPGRRHGRHIVEHVALRLLHRAEIRRHLVRLHYNLAKEHDARADDLADHAHHADDRVHLGQVPAVRSQFLPDIGNCINADDVHALVGQVEEIIHHLIEHPRVAVVQIPLIGIESGHHIMPHLRKVCEVARRRRREYLGHGLLIFLRDRRICIEEVAAHIFAVSLAGFYRPLMILRRMIHHEIHAQTDPFVMAFLRQFRQIIHGSQIRLYFPEIRHRITAVRAAFRGIQEGHQMDVIHIAAFKIREFLLHPFDIAGKVVDVHHHADHIAFAVPFAFRLALRIKFFQLVVSQIVITLHLSAQLCEHIVIAVQLHIEPAQLVMMTSEALRKYAVIFRFFPVRRFCRSCRFHGACCFLCNRFSAACSFCGFSCHGLPLHTFIY